MVSQRLLQQLEPRQFTKSIGGSIELEAEKLADLESQKILLKDINLSLKKHVVELQTENHVINRLITSNLSVKSSYVRGKIILGALCAISIFLIIQYAFSDSIFEIGNYNTAPIKTKYLIDNLKGDKVQLWQAWKITKDSQLTVNIVNSEIISQDKMDAIKHAIFSEERLLDDVSTVDKEGTKPTTVYYTGWTGAVKEASSTSTTYTIPSSFNVIESPKGEGDIIIRLTNERDSDGYTGYTKSIVDENEILKVYITIYDVDALQPEQLSAITRHEFGHAIGLAHSTATQDIMAPSIQPPYPFVSECDVDAIISLYDGKGTSEVVCKT